MSEPADLVPVLQPVVHQQYAEADPAVKAALRSLGKDRAAIKEYLKQHAEIWVGLREPADGGETDDEVMDKVVDEVMAGVGDQLEEVLDANPEIAEALAGLSEEEFAALFQQVAGG
jgi:hypothetical protein